MDLVLFAVGLAFYLTASVGFVAYLLAAKDGLRQVALGALTMAFAVETLAIVLRPGMVAGFAPSSFHDQLTLLTWFTVGLYLLLQLRYQLTVVGALVSPLAFLLTLSAYFVYSGVRALPAELQDAWLPAHVAPAFLGYAIFALAFCVSLVYLLQERQLKSRRRGALLRRLPALESLDDLNYRFVAWGFAIFTIGIVTGAMLAKARWGAFWSWEPVQVLSVITWLLYAILLQTRSAGWRGRRAATLTIVGFALLVLSFLSFNLGFPGRHGGAVG
jgi:cytochrome c-type biogenesis protein CcsB